MKASIGFLTTIVDLFVFGTGELVIGFSDQCSSGQPLKVVIHKRMAKVHVLIYL